MLDYQRVPGMRNAPLVLDFVAASGHSLSLSMSPRPRLCCRKSMRACHWSRPPDPANLQNTFFGLGCPNDSSTSAWTKVTEIWGFSSPDFFVLDVKEIHHYLGYELMISWSNSTPKWWRGPSFFGGGWEGPSMIFTAMWTKSSFAPTTCVAEH